MGHNTNHSILNSKTALTGHAISNTQSALTTPVEKIIPLDSPGMENF